MERSAPCCRWDRGILDQRHGLASMGTEDRADPVWVPSIFGTWPGPPRIACLPNWGRSPSGLRAGRPTGSTWQFPTMTASSCSMKTASRTCPGIQTTSIYFILPGVRTAVGSHRAATTGACVSGMKKDSRAPCSQVRSSTSGGLPGTARAGSPASTTEATFLYGTIKMDRLGPHGSAWYWMGSQSHSMPRAIACSVTLR